MVAAPRRSNAQRTAQMRARLLDATIDVLIDRGYDRLATTDVCRRAGVSRGAMLHHFPSKGELVAAAVDHLFQVRHGAFRKVAEEQPGRSLDEAMDDLWEIYSGGTLYAWMELCVAARTDADLRPVVKDVNDRFVAEAEQTFQLVFGGPIPQVKAATRLVLALFDGLAMNNTLEDDDTLSRQVIALFQGLAAPWISRG